MRVDQRSIAAAHGVYYALTGVWSLVSIRTFEAVTGPKAERWLVKTVGVLVLVIGGVLLRAARRPRVSSDIALLAAGSAAGLAAIDVVYVAKRRIAPVYLLDALAEAILVAGWVAARRGDRGPGRAGR
ncbi:MAG: hypothetical protein AVDCRST_MAG49-2992 [uncultured Thermomicrobiales bacterium]|uniref:Uncharacterized protein n=1 Tax=uncultured Thermomicrobiales bacterium TaxID=1645740 RepID=A0A6J4USH2_9BACT|nr:MAG: hypothetical protein AVDCRST_MAG49-2992 [uncultured Thermomicrobiales bacterium]